MTKEKLDHWAQQQVLNKPDFLHIQRNAKSLGLATEDQTWLMDRVDRYIAQHQLQMQSKQNAQLGIAIGILVLIGGVFLWFRVRDYSIVLSVLLWAGSGWVILSLILANVKYLTQFEITFDDGLPGQKVKKGKFGRF